MSYRVVTVCNKIPTEPYYCLVEWGKSLNGHQAMILGWGGNQYGGLGSKPRLLYQAIKGGAIQESHIIFCDCFDLVFAAPLDELFEKYLSFETPIVISAEKNCFPTDLKDEYDKIPQGTSYKYLNSGMIVAEKEALLTALESMDAANIPNDYWDAEKGQMVNPNDQQYWQETFLKQPVPIVLDTYQTLCNTLHSLTINDLDFSGERIRNIETNSMPCAFHMNGSAKTDGLREPILNHLKLV